MAETYDITYEGVSVGSADMEKQGLYYAFSCRCRLPEEGLYRIHVTCAENREDLGICVPIGGTFGMDKKISAKRLGEGKPAFELLPKDWKPQETVVEPEPEFQPVEEEKQVVETPVFEGEKIETEENIVFPEPAGENFFPVSEEKAFGHLDKLENAVMDIRSGEVGIVIQETQ